MSTTHTVRTPYTVVKIEVAHDEDWYDAVPQLLDEEGKPLDLTGKSLTLFIRPVYDHSILIKQLSIGSGIQIDSAANGYFTFNVPQAQIAALPLLPNGSAATYDQFLVLSQSAEPREIEVWRGQFVVHPARRS